LLLCEKREGCLTLRLFFYKFVEFLLYLLQRKKKLEPTAQITSEVPVKRRLEISNHWQHYILCLMFHILLPLLPIGIELFTTGYLKASTLTIIASMYAISIGTSSKSPLEFGFCMVGSIIFAIMFGVNSSNETLLGDGNVATQLSIWNNSKTSSVIFMIIVVVIHCMARYNRHIVFKQPFWEFIKTEEK
jgi:hypothetical protein